MAGSRASATNRRHTTPVPEKFDILFERRESPVVAPHAGDDRARLARMDRDAA
jgi:hypothetical protein